MSARLSPRIAAGVAALPLRPGMRVLEVGCGTGMAAREVVRRVGESGFVLGIDRSRAAVAKARDLSRDRLTSGVLDFRVATAEGFERHPGEDPFDLAFAMRVGALDGRHPELFSAVMEHLRRALHPGAPVIVDGRIVAGRR